MTGSRPRFVVGTGRCGSTLLSRMLGEHSGVLSLFEFFTGLDMARRFGGAPIPGAELAEIVGAEQPFVTAVLRRGYPVEEITYPFDEPGAETGARYRVGDPLPWLLVSTLPRLSDQPDALFDEVLAFARRQPPRRPRDHYRALFAWLADERGHSLWIERSGSSVDYLAELAVQFPDALFLHIHRDGREVALSMREHHAYRLPISLMYDAPVASGKHLAELEPPEVHAPPRGDDTVSQILASRPSPFYFGRYWCDQVRRGVAAGRELPADRYRTIRFEDLVARPDEVLAGIGDFFDLPPDGGWLARGAALVRGVPPSRRPALGAAEGRALDEACAPGMALLGR